MTSSRKFAKTPCDMFEEGSWPGFRDLTVEEQWAYHTIRGQRDVTQAGTIAFRPARWAEQARGMTPDRMNELVDRLTEAGRLVVDRTHGEVLIRWFMETDEVFRYPNSVVAAEKIIKGYVFSPGIKAVLWEELRRAEAVRPFGSPEVRIRVNGLIGYLDRFANPSTRDRLPIETPSTIYPHDIERVSAAGGLVLHAGPPEVAAKPGATSPNRDEGIGTLSQHSLGLTEDAEPKQETRNKKPSLPAAGAADARPEVDELCQHLINRLRGNGVTTRLEITQKWRTATRLMLDKDGRSVTQVRNMIDWCQDDEFWRSNVMSMPTLREQYEQLRLKALASVNGRHRPDPRYTAGSGQMAAPAPSGTGVRI